ncbi:MULTISPECIES: ribbon-helix-helix protein, CopG family [Sphingobium]|uniref:ribbon-helix-helix protein, CopG family n=1 Tax=Sphingobium TaxID=165695 RepID=UPI000DBB2086|nr:ribbon-helix-helix protein, CopG family [Sphingobium sp. YG1]BBD02262.1 hypothetical protein YGS_C2P0275 [Sphingobium sp. YG1]
MSDVPFTFRVDEALIAAFTALAEARDMSAAQMLRTAMQEAVTSEREAAAHDRWFRRQVEDAMHAADEPRTPRLSSEVIEEEWRDQKARIDSRDGP